MENVKYEKFRYKLELYQSLVSTFSSEATLQGPAVSVVVIIIIISNTLVFNKTLNA